MEIKFIPQIFPLRKSIGWVAFFYMKYDLFLENAAPQNVMLGYNLNVSDLSPEVTISKS